MDWLQLLFLPGPLASAQTSTSVSGTEEVPRKDLSDGQGGTESLPFLGAWESGSHLLPVSPELSLDRPLLDTRPDLDAQRRGLFPLRSQFSHL